MPIPSVTKPASTVPPTAADDERWAAMIRRDRTADSTFFYSVKTTGVYCRPSCGARRPLRQNVQFHQTIADAEAAGFRPCKRCRPDEPPLAERHAAIVASACELIRNAPITPDLSELAVTAGMSRFHFQRVFKSVTGLTPKAYATAHRTRRMQQNLKRGSTITDAIYESGFNSSGPFYSTSSHSLGMTPTQFRNGATGVRIRYSVRRCSLGSVLAAATDKGVCAILLGDEPDALVKDLRDRFQHSVLIGDDPTFEKLMAEVIAVVEEPALGIDLPLDVRGTAFQHRVWQALREIPAGSTSTYAEVAAKIGAPGAARAVSRACAANPAAVAIPCHRVVRKDGNLAGYRWGIDRKRALLQHEAPETA